ncbi:MAG: glycosyltransferase family 1 protein [Chloroflexota bacterium]
MNVVVNGRFLGRRVTGVERYGREVLRRLGGRPRVVRSGRGTDGARGHLWEQAALPGLVGPGQLLWSPANTGPLRVANQVLTLHDLGPLEHPEWYRATFGLWYRLFVPPLVRRVRRVVTSSEFVRAKLMRRFGLPGGRVTVVPGGVDTEIFHPNAPRTLDLPPKYALFVGSLQPRKNLPGLLAAWGQVEDAVPEAWLVIAGTGGAAFRPVSLIAAERVKFLGAVAEPDLPGLYAGASLAVLPSFDEGFGLTALEAMACGAPVAASTAGALPEVVGEAGLAFDPHDLPGMAEALRRGLTDEGLGKSLREKGPARAEGFPWQAAAGRMREVFEECL